MIRFHLTAIAGTRAFSTRALHLPLFSFTLRSFPISRVPAVSFRAFTHASDTSQQQLQKQSQNQAVVGAKPAQTKHEQKIHVERTEAEKIQECPSVQSVDDFTACVVDSSNGRILKPAGYYEPTDQYALPHPIHTWDEANQIRVTHLKPHKIRDRIAYWAIKTIRFNFDVISGYRKFPSLRQADLDRNRWLLRFVFLESIAGVPGMVGGTMRYFRSMRRFRHDGGWIHTLMEEAENERMHLMTFMRMRRSGRMLKAAVLVSQNWFRMFYAAVYLLSPKTAHRMVGYLEEEAVKTYTHCLEDIDSGMMGEWKTERAPKIAKIYWKMDDNATVRDLILMVRADEAHHRLVNHTLSSLPQNVKNPFKPGE